MIVAALRRLLSTNRSRSCPSDQRLPAPARFGARSPWNFCSGNGPLWQRMQVLVRSTTSARPRVASPRAVSGSGMASPTIAYGRKACAPAGQGASIAAVNHIAAIWITDLAKRIHRYRLEPVCCALGLALANLARRIDRARRVLDLGEQPVLGLIDAGLRERMARCDRIVAGPGQPRRIGRFARQHVHNPSRAGLALRLR